MRKLADVLVGFELVVVGLGLILVAVGKIAVADVVIAYLALNSVRQEIRITLLEERLGRLPVIYATASDQQAFDVAKFLSEHDCNFELHAVTPCGEKTGKED